MSLLRLLTNERVMAGDILSPREALSVYRNLLSDERVEFAAEPRGIEAAWESLMTSPQASGAAWTDAWLAALAIETRIRVITFDSGMRRWAGLAVDILLKGAPDS
jgi:predicted nucleic acid-binding protein